jgi:hypothetical protein
VVDGIVRAGLALLFASAAAHKLRDRRRFRETLAEYRLLPAAAVSIVAGLLIAVEAGIAMSLVTIGGRLAGLTGAAAVLVVYAGGIGINLARGRRDLDCGCAGPAVRRPISGWLVGRNLVLAALALAATAPVSPRALVWADGLTIVAATAALVALYAACDGLVAQLPAIARLRSVA